jgi:hypothetical protein
MNIGYVLDDYLPAFVTNLSEERSNGLFLSLTSSREQTSSRAESNVLDKWRNCIETFNHGLITERGETGYGIAECGFEVRRTPRSA